MAAILSRPQCVNSVHVLWLYVYMLHFGKKKTYGNAPLSWCQIDIKLSACNHHADCSMIKD